jgi:transcriptional regulator with XRE-family HTH domain
MGAINETLRNDLSQPEFSEGYAESFLDAYVAAQIKTLREENDWTQSDLAKEIGTTQTAISRIENINYSAWNVKTLKKLARAFRLRLKVSFETYGSLIHDLGSFNRESLKRVPREKDSELSKRAGKREKPIRALGNRQRKRVLRRKPIPSHCFNSSHQLPERKPPARARLPNEWHPEQSGQDGALMNSSGIIGGI